MGHARMHSRYELGNLVFFEDGHRQRWIDAIGPNVIKYINDFDSYGEDWTETVVSVGSGTSVIGTVSKEGGVLSILAAGNENDGLQIQPQTFGFKPSPGDPIYFGARWALHGCGYGSADIMIGLCIEDTSLIAGTTSGIYFQTVDAATSILGVCELADVPTTTTMIAAATVDTYYVTEFYWDGSSKVEFWIDGVSKGTETLSIPTSQSLAVSIAYLNGAAHGEGVAGLYVDYVRCIQLLSDR